MARSNRKLATLRKVREMTRDQRRLHLAEAQHAETILEQQRSEFTSQETELLVQRRRSASPNSFDLNQLIDAQRHQLVLESERAVLDNQWNMLAEEVNRRRLALVQSDQEVRAVERLEKKLNAAEQSAQAQHENRELDEAALQSFMRRWRKLKPCN